MQTFNEWYTSYNPDLDLELDDVADELRSAYEAGYKQRDKEINEHYRKVMKDEESNEVGIPMSPVGDLDYSC